MLTAERITAYLVDRGWLSGESIVDDGVVVIDASRRNLNLAVTCNGGRSFFCKQGKRFGRFSSARYESEFYERLASKENGSNVRRHIPEKHFYDESQDILGLEYIKSATSLREYHVGAGRKFPVWIGKELGSVLAAIHGLDCRDAPESRPPALFLHTPDLQIYRDSSAASLHLIRIIQHYEEFAAKLTFLREEWVATSLIHGDLKWDNCLIVPPGEARKKRSLRIVDWETHAFGDPLWDVGTIIGECLRHWLNSIPITNDAPSEDLLDLAGFSLPEMQPGLQAFWNTYSTERSLLGEARWAGLIKAMKYAGAILVQFAFEQVQSAPALNTNVICFLQLSLNVLEQPLEAIAHLLGIPMREEDLLCPNTDRT
jgi:Phosphotransferase enzyme family